MIGTKVLAPIARNVVQKRSISAVSGPPTVHVSTGEKLVLGSIMISSMLAFPAYVLVNIKNWRAPK